MSITGAGAPIDHIEWWAEGPGGNPGPNNDDLALSHVIWPCNGAQPCTGLWTVTVRNAGFYNIHAVAYDVNGGATRTDWNPHVSS